MPAEYSYSKTARERRQAMWQEGKNFALRDVLEQARGASIVYAGDTDEQYYFLLGVADTCYAAARDVAGLDQRKGEPEGKRKSR